MFVHAEVKVPSDFDELADKFFSAFENVKLDIFRGW
jgi:hypothetical protein